MALSDFFPYGAPEMLEGASARMARSTMTASLAVALVVVGMGATFSHQVTVAIAPDPTGTIVDIIDPNVFEPMPPTGPVSPTKIAPAEATPIPVPDVLMKPGDIEQPVTSSAPGGEPGTGPIAGESSGGIGSIPVPHTPKWDEYVPFDELPVKIRCADAVYPDLPKLAGVEGTVRVLMLVGLDGRVENAIIAPRGSVPMLDQAALDAARTCVFTPALANGHPVKVWVSQSYRFSLH